MLIKAKFLDGITVIRTDLDNLFRAEAKKLLAFQFAYYVLVHSGTTQHLR